MKKLKRVVIENFQCHKKTVIEPSLEGLTVITGPTDHGKSAIVRAMKWLLYNRPLGTDFIRHGQTECKVTFEFADGTIVQRRRTTSLNQYYVNGQLYEGFGNGVPLEVQQATGVYIYEVADQTLNLNVSEQLAGPFLGSSISAPLRARILGKLAGTEDIDRAHKKLGTDIYHAKQNIKRLEEDIYHINAEIENYKWVEPLGIKIEQLETLHKEIRADIEMVELLEEKRDQLHQIDSLIIDAQNQLKWYQDILPVVRQLIDGMESDIPLMDNLVDKKYNLDQLNLQIRQLKLAIYQYSQPEKALELINEADTNIARLKDMEILLDQYEDLSWQLNQINITIREKEQILTECGQPEEALKLLEQCNKYINGLNKYEELAKYYVYYTTEIEVQEIALARYEELVTKAREEYKEALKEAEVCPVCGSDINEEYLDRVI